ncbi:fumarylacetoacetate hydrolase family protein [Natrinema salifodinae]|uniref:2-keto-4-pentenoate hydratase/2-oxohepta-3-ene-1,7-dioic acid hydratase (Catechol pathway) n=1 Tax=Natrinema salifodinae TaxID=1202768 RepID=A0A1I0LXP4_9EURY|nr:fumarylacetoacetate hydrolase family protein [Natrinema salifodinae]SEV80274.1 2-keto-4-pentenoate hydratase/2-oxohepta-3-ene-1,7-dioic acid hydratase (catechol pathway) [Natrinema salifodinae]
MRFVRFNDERLGLLTDDGDGIVDVTDRLGLETTDPLREYANRDLDASEYADAEADYDREEVRIESPVRRPGKVIAAPLNYENHVEEALADKDIVTQEWFTIEDKGYFLKAPSSVAGPEDGIELPFTDRRVDHEIELAFIMGEDVKDIDSDDVWDAVLGYTILLDVSVRGDQDRSNRKSYDTFTIVGPCVATPDEVGDPHDLEMELQLNGETRQQENTGEMIYSCADIVEYASIGATIEAGDVVTTGTPEGVSAITGGDTIEAEIENVGSMTVDVTERDLAFEDVDVEKSQLDE